MFRSFYIRSSVELFKKHAAWLKLAEAPAVPRKTWWYNFSRPASKRYKDDPLKPKQGPYVWHVKDELSAKEKIKATHLPYLPWFHCDVEVVPFST